MNAAILFSGGKDSTMALYYALKMGEDVKYLLSMKLVKTDYSNIFFINFFSFQGLLICLYGYFNYTKNFSIRCKKVISWRKIQNLLQKLKVLEKDRT